MASEYLADALQTSLAVGQARKRAAEVAQQVGMQRAAQEQEMGIRAMQAQAMAEERQARAAGMADQARERDINLRAEVLSNTEDLAPDFNGPPSPDAVNPDAPGALQGIEEAVAQARAKAARNKVLGVRNKEELTRSDKLAGDEASARKEAREDERLAQGDRKIDAALAAANRPRGGGDGDKFDTPRFKAANDLRDDFERKFKPYGEVGTRMNIMKTAAGDNTGASDIALVTTFMKMLDPGSVVRESEFALARDTGSMWEGLKAQANKIQNGALLTPQMRQNLLHSATQFAEGSFKQAGKVKKDYETRARKYGLDPADVMLGVGDDEPAPAPSGGSSGGAPAGGGGFKIVRRIG